MGHPRGASHPVLPWIPVILTALVGRYPAAGIDICANHDVTFPAYGGLPGSRGVITYNSSDYLSPATVPSPCVTRFTVSPDSKVNLSMKHNSFIGCRDRDLQYDIRNSKSKICDTRCTYLFAYDPNYFNSSVRYFFSGEKWSYASLSKRSVVSLCVSSVNPFPMGEVSFKISYEVTLKESVYMGSSQETSSPGVIRSVNFPEGYVTDGDTYSYMIQSQNQDDFISLVFDDWDLDGLSFIEFERANVERVEGADYRPVVTSTRNWVRFKFSTGNQYGSILSRTMGFKVTYRFTSNRQNNEPSTNCGAYKLDSSGGVLQFSGPASAYRPVKYDCVWVVKRQPQFQRIYLRLLDSTIYKSSNWEEPNRFFVHYGLTSDSGFVQSFPPESTEDAKAGFKSNDGFYIRLIGNFYQDDKFKMAYASYDSLPAGTDQCTYGMFTCSNKRCIDRALKCDGADHCGDNSDELNCPSSPQWGTEGSSPFSLSISIIIPIVVAMFLVIVICLFIVFLRRCQQLQRRQPGRNSQVPSVSGRMARGRRTRRSQIRVTIQQEYEDAPPTYEEAIGTPPNLGYFNMAFMWSQPDLPTGLMSPPPYADVIGSPEEEGGASPRYPVENDPNRQLTATDSLHSHRGRDRRDTQVQTQREAERQSSGQRGQAPQTGDLHIVLRRNSNTPSSGNNSLEHNRSIGRQPLGVPLEAVYGKSQQRSKHKDTASPQISVTNEGAKDTPHQSSASVQAQVAGPETGAGVQPAGVPTDQQTAPPTSRPQSAGKHRGAKGHRRRNRHRNPECSPPDDTSPSGRPPHPGSAPAPVAGDCDTGGRTVGNILYPQPEATVTLAQNPGTSAAPRLLRQSYSQADIPTSVERSGPPDPRRASSAGRLLPDDRRSSERPHNVGERPHLSPVPQEDVEAPRHSASSHTINLGRGEGTFADIDEEEEYRQRVSQSSQQLRLFLRRNASDDEDMYV